MKKIFQRQPEKKCCCAFYVETSFNLKIKKLDTGPLSCFVLFPLICSLSVTSKCLSLVRISIISLDDVSVLVVLALTTRTNHNIQIAKGHSFNLLCGDPCNTRILSHDVMCVNISV